MCWLTVCALSPSFPPSSREPVAVPVATAVACPQQQQGYGQQQGYAQQQQGYGQQQGYPQQQQQQSPYYNQQPPQQQGKGGY